MATVVITGGTGAIGTATVAALEKRRAQVVKLSRPAFDLSAFASVRAAARDLNREVRHIDALIHVAAVYMPRWQKTVDGLELMLEVNHLGPFLLTNLLRDRLAGGGRVITVAAPSSTRVDMARMLDRDRFNPFYSFGATKAANLMFTFELARRAKRWDVRANAFHPGLVKSELMRDSPGPLRVITRFLSRGPEHAAHDLADLALSTAHAGTTGWFFKGARRIDAPRTTLDEGQQGLLWKRSAELVELEGGF
ncbi:MAG TPA: SDR family NAD(P)-dependent oxidoreductase [Candidatus Dormibacteraeota bacterium]|nr:SDR family NAD(P)-dependent oxidoreductase [Candidatus Dormibacteraeota bacterium]